MNNLESMWAIRDARGLTTDQKVFLYTVATRGEGGMWTKQETAADDMGLSKATYYRVRKQLLDLEVIKVQQRMNDTSVYLINEPVLLSLCETKESQPETEGSLCETQGSLSETEGSHCAETKINKKITNKRNSKTTKKTNTVTTAATAPEVPQLPLSSKDSKEDQPLTLRTNKSEPSSLCSIEESPAVSLSPNTTHGDAAGGRLSVKEAKAHAEYAHFLPKTATPEEARETMRVIVWRQERLPKSAIHVQDALSMARTNLARKSIPA